MKRPVWWIRTFFRSFSNVDEAGISVSGIFCGSLVKKSDVDGVLVLLGPAVPDVVNFYPRVGEANPGRCRSGLLVSKIRNEKGCV